MRIISKLLFSIFIFGLYFSSSAQETFINENWNLINGFIGQELKIASRINPDGKLVYLSNHIQGLSSADIYLSTVDPDGNVEWEVTCPSTQGLEDYGTALEIDQSGNIYVCAAQNNLNDLDYWIAKYSESGVLLWEQNYSGTANGDDIPLDITLDANNNPVVTGYVWNGNTSNDIATLKLNSSNGDILWSTEYVEQLEQQAYKVEIDANQNVVVAGVDADSLIHGGVMLVRYNGQTGSQMQATTVYSSSSGVDVLRQMRIAPNGHIIIAGASNLNTINSDIMVLSFTQSLQLNWEKYIDREYSMDEALDVTLNSNGDIIYTGYTTKGSGGQEIIVSKLNASNGSEVWKFQKTALIETDYVRGKSLTTDADNNIYVTGTELREGQEQFLTICLRDDGEVSWAKYFSNSAQSEDFAEKIQIDEFNQIYVTGVSIENNQPAIATVSYTINEKEITFVLDAEGKPTRIQGEVIVQFSPERINPSVFNDKRIISGQLTKFVDSTMLADLETFTGMDWTRFETYKAFKRLTMTDTLSVTRLGDTIRMSDYWATVLVALPEGIDELQVANYITDLEGINYSVTNDILHQMSPPNDSLFVTNNQLALHPNSIYPNSDINVLGAWNQGKVGEEHVKVGVFDNVIDWSHQEFGSTQTLQASKVKGGYNYYSNLPIDFILGGTDTHGTKVAGVIGAFSNNGMGVAGVAGGDLSVGNEGAQLYSMGISMDDTSFADIVTISEAIIEGAIDPVNPGDAGFGLHIQNHSWGTDSPNYHLKEAVDECWRNHCIFVAAIGNNNNSSPNYPAAFQDLRVLNVIASGIDGERMDVTNGYGNWGSSYGWDGSQNYPLVEPDFMAPGVRELVSTTTAEWDNTSSVCLGSTLDASKYRCFDGSSAAAPLVAGVAALMYSEHVPANGYPNPLTTEDIEELMQSTAVDRDVAGYDYQSGFGLIDASEAVRVSSDPYYVVHKKYGNNDASMNWLSNGSQVFHYLGQDAGNQPIIEYHDHVDVFRFIWNVFDTLPAGHEIVDVWNVEAGWRTALNLNSNPVTIISEATGEATTALNYTPGGTLVHGYAHTDLYLITEMQNGVPVTQYWYPFSPSELKFEYSIHVNSDPMANLNEQDQSDLVLYPNPNNGSFTVSFDLLDGGNIELMVTDALGKIVKLQEFENLNSGQNSLQVEMNGLQHGVYYCTLRSSDGVRTIPFVKAN